MKPTKDVEDYNPAQSSFGFSNLRQSQATTVPTTSFKENPFTPVTDNKFKMSGVSNTGCFDTFERSPIVRKFNVQDEMM